MIYKNKSRNQTWTEDYLFHYRKVMADTRRDMSAGTAKLGPTLRTLSRIYSSATLLLDYCQKHFITLSGMKVPLQFEVMGSDGNVYTLGMTMDPNSVLTTGLSNKNAAKSRELMKGDEFAAMIQYDHIGASLSKIANDGRGRFKIVAHHPALMRRMSAFQGDRGPIYRSFTLSVDNDMAVTDFAIYTRRHWMALPASKLTSEFVNLRCAKVSDEAQMLAEGLVEQGCYTASPTLNGLLVMMHEASVLKEQARTAIHELAARVKKHCCKHKGFSSFGQHVNQDGAVVIPIDIGIVAISGAPCFSIKSAQNANVPLIRSLVGNKMASVEVQQLQFGTTAKPAAHDKAHLSWDACMHYITNKVEPNMKISHEKLRKERAYLRELKL